MTWLFRTLFPRATTFLVGTRLMATAKVQKSDSEWRAVLNKEQFRVLREKGTEAPYVGKYDKFKEEGMSVYS